MARGMAKTGNRPHAGSERIRPPGGGRTSTRVCDAQSAKVRFTRHAFQGDWNYTISPC